MNSEAVFDFYLLRSPVFPLELARKLFSAQSNADLEKYFSMLFKDTFIKDALWLSSPDLFRELQRGLDGTDPLNQRLLKTLYKYTIRMSTRSTPYGLFAGVSAGKIREEAEASLSMLRAGNNRVEYRLDIECINSMYRHLNADKSIRSQLKFYLNSTLYQQGEVFKFYQSYQGPGKTAHLLKSIRSNTLLEKILNHISGGKNYSALILWLTREGFSNAQANNFVDKLITNQIIISELQPVLTGGSFLIQLKEQLAKVDIKKQYIKSLSRVEDLLKADAPLTEKSREINATLKATFPNLRYTNLLQGDLYLNTFKNYINRRTVDRITQQLQQLQGLSVRNSNPVFDRFKEMFERRYGSGMVSLLQALDPDTGIAYGNDTSAYTRQDAILKDIDFSKSQTPKHLEHHSNHALFIKLYLQAVKDKQMEIELDPSDLECMENREEGTGSALSHYAMGNLLRNPEDNSMLFNLNGYGGVSAGNLIARFGYLDQELTRKLKDIGSLEQAKCPDSIVAEVVHLPDKRAGNVLQRSLSREAEIGLLAKPKEGRMAIKLSDLYLFMQQGRLVLWSESQGKEVIPRLTSAHNFHRGINIYRFFGDLQSQDHRLNLRWDWGIVSKAPFLPRIRFKNIIVSRATWYLKQIAPVSDSEDIDECFKQLQCQYNLPDELVLSEGDNELLLNFSHKLSVSILMGALAKGDVTLYESLFSSFQSPVQDSDSNTYANEIIIPLYSKEKSADEVIPPRSTDLQRIFPLGSSWVYIKIYCGYQLGDRILQKQIPLIIRELRKYGKLRKWFFIRYRDPDHHIRLRIEGIAADDFMDITKIIQKILLPLFDKNQITNIVFDSYEREIERYTPECMLLSEALFCADSSYVLHIMQEKQQVQERWLPALRGVDELLVSAGCTVAEKQRLCQRMKDHFAVEFGRDKQHDVRFNQKFREIRATIEATILQNKMMDNDRTEMIQKIIAIINENKEKKLSLVTSYIHMFINRLFPVDQRLYEFAVYHLLNNYYRMVIGKQRTLQAEKGV